MLIKSLISFLVVSTFLMSAQAHTGEQLVVKVALLNKATETCAGVVDSHMQIIEETEEYFYKTFNLPDSQFSFHELQNLQKVMKLRYEHLNKVLAKFQSKSDCNLSVLGDVVAIYDFNVLSESIIKNIESRRIVYSFTQAQDYQMENFKKDYNHYTRLSTIKDAQNNLTQQNLGLLEMFGLKLNQDDDGTKISTTSDRLKRSWNWILGKGLIRSWGLLSDNLKVRHGYLRDDVERRESLRRSLKPLDLMFEQRRFVLSNLTIPGHWGHVAVWLGTKEELQALGVWDREDFSLFRENIEQGKNIVQMRKEGVVFSSLEEFMNLDEIAVMRVKSVQSQQASVYPRLAEHLNKKYDFSFEAKSLGKITCTEFIAFSFGEIKWPTRTSMGRLVIAPDDMAKLSLDNSQAELVMYVGSDSEKSQVKTTKDWLGNIP
jgi:hypothetical protein